MKGLTFCRNEYYDNSECLKKLPYEGQSWWGLQTKHVLRHKQYLLGNGIDVSNFKYVKAVDLKFNEIYAINFYEANSYVLGDSNKVPELLEFNRDEHVVKFRESDIIQLGFYSKTTVKNMCGYIYIPEMEYQILIR